jgi:hypothetical protein
MKKTVIFALFCLSILQAFAADFQKSFDAQSQQLLGNFPAQSLAADFPKSFEEYSKKISEEISDKLNYAAANTEEWRKSIAFIEIEVAQKEVLVEGGGARYNVDGKIAIYASSITHKHTCLGAIADPGVIITARGCLYTEIERNPSAPTELTIIDPNLSFPNPFPIRIEKAIAIIRSYNGSIIAKKDVTKLFNKYFSSEGSDLLTWKIDTSLPKFALPNASQAASLWADAAFIAYDKEMSYKESKVEKIGTSDSCILLNIRKQKTAGDLVISKKGYLLGINRLGYGTPALDFGITTIGRPEIVPTISGSNNKSYKCKLL